MSQVIIETESVSKNVKWFKREIIYVIFLTEADRKKFTFFSVKLIKFGTWKRSSYVVQWLTSQKSYNFQGIVSSFEILVCFMWVHRRNLFAKRLKFLNNHFELRNFGAFWVISLTALVRKNVELFRQTFKDLKLGGISYFFFDGAGWQKINVCSIKLIKFCIWMNSSYVVQWMGSQKDNNYQAIGSSFETISINLIDETC